MKLSKGLSGRSQNLHLIRFVAAVCVILGHAFPISGAGSDCLSQITEGRLTLGALAVFVFFLAGGILIAKSMDRLKTAKKYFKVRALRIFPPLIFVTVSVTFMGAFMTEYSPQKYFFSMGTWKYLLNCVFVLIHNLPGVFTGNPYMATVNGSLWTLPVEFLCYIACYAMYKMNCFGKKRYIATIPFVFIGVAAIRMLAVKMPLLAQVIYPCLLFYVGIGYYIYRDDIELKFSWMLIALAGFIFSVVCNVMMIGWLFFFPYVIFTLCFGIKQVSLQIAQLGNYSYGMYLWGFPVQQAVVHFMAKDEGMNAILNFTVSLPIVFVLGVLTYQISEKPLAKIKT